mmetsp:Transcript_26154/g.61179  ORF Transcript_26154/g.61179 Transcript_26154/m.61179 type:complete len:304 (-) Transcript_26154:1275-2186(-)
MPSTPHCEHALNATSAAAEPADVGEDASGAIGAGGIVVVGCLRITPLVSSSSAPSLLFLARGRWPVREMTIDFSWPTRRLERSPAFSTSAASAASTFSRLLAQNLSSVACLLATAPVSELRTVSLAATNSSDPTTQPYRLFLRTASVRTIGSVGRGTTGCCIPVITSRTAKTWSICASLCASAASCLPCESCIAARPPKCETASGRAGAPAIGGMGALAYGASAAGAAAAAPTGATFKRQMSHCSMPPMRGSFQYPTSLLSCSILDESKESLCALAKSARISATDTALFQLGSRRLAKNCLPK